MQYRMKTHQLTKEQIKSVLMQEMVGTLATINEDGTPYVTPVHYVYHEDHVYIHGLPAGQKVENIERNNSVCFNVYHIIGLLLDEEEKPCDTNTAYESVIINGAASFIEDPKEKKEILGLIIEKYTPQLSGKTLPENMVNGTKIICIRIHDITGKYWN